MHVPKFISVFIAGWCCLFCIAPLISNAQAPKIATTVNKQDIVIGQPLKVKIEATFQPDTYNIGWLNFPDSTAHFEMIDRGKTDTIKDNGLITLRQVFTITSFDSGLRTVPSFPVNFIPASGDKAFNLFTDSVRVNVSYSPMDSTKTFHDIKTIIEVKDEWPIWMWIAAGLSLLLLIFLIWYLVKNLRKKKVTGPLSSKLSPLDEAKKLLAELQKEQLLQQAQFKKYHVRLGEIFKRYISRKTGVNLLNKTSEEILLSLAELNTGKENLGIIAGNLRMADAVKFAKYIPANSDSENALAQTQQVILQIDQTLKISKSDI